VTSDWRAGRRGPWQTPWSLRRRRALPDGSEATRPKRSPATWAVALVLAVVAVALVLEQSAIRPFEARLSAMILAVTRLASAKSVGTVVAFPLGSRGAGAYSITTGCTVVLLLSPFFFIAGALVASGRTSIARGLATMGAVGLALVAVNQARFMVVAASMRVWGFRLGFERSHVFLGTVVSTLGVLAALLAFIWSAIPRIPREQLA
jgi:exosortase/archaeosortase family protein